MLFSFRIFLFVSVVVLSLSCRPHSEENEFLSRPVCFIVQVNRIWPSSEWAQRKVAGHLSVAASNCYAVDQSGEHSCWWDRRRQS